MFDKMWLIGVVAVWLLIQAGATCTIRKTDGGAYAVDGA
jgi:hypothetical protein